MSTVDQNPPAQNDALDDVDAIRVFVDRASGARADPAQLAACLDYLRAGDTLVVWRLDGLGRSLAHLIDVVDQLRDREIEFRGASRPAFEPLEPLRNVGLPTAADILAAGDVDAHEGLVLAWGCQLWRAWELRKRARMEPRGRSAGRPLAGPGTDGASSVDGVDAAPIHVRSHAVPPRWVPAGQSRGRPGGSGCGGPRDG